MGYAKYYYNEQENTEIEVFLKNAHQLHNEFSSAKSTITATKIMNYVVNLLKACSDDIIEPRFFEGYFKNHFLKDPEQMLLHTGEIASMISCNAMNEVDSHTTTLAVLSILQQFTWETKALLIVASYILTYANDGLNLSVQPEPPNKVSVKDDELLSFIRGLLKISNRLVLIDRYPIYFVTNEGQLGVEAMTQLMVVVYSITRVVVVAASSKLMKRSSIGDMEDKYGTSGSTWCSANLDFIEKQLDIIESIFWKATGDSGIRKEEEDEEEVRYSYFVLREATVENIDVNVVGDTLLINYNYVDVQWEEEIELGKKYRKEEIRAVLNKNDGWLHITLPKFKKPADPHSLHIPVTLSTSSSS